MSEESGAVQESRRLRSHAAGHEHLLCDLWVDDAAILERVEPWPEILRGVAERIGAQVIGQQFEQFEPCGVTGYLLLAESHVSVHTWPEEGLAAIDVFGCGKVDADRVVGWLRKRLASRQEKITLLIRGST